MRTQLWLSAVLQLSCIAIALAQDCFGPDIAALLEWPLAARLGWNTSSNAAHWPGVLCNPSGNGYNISLNGSGLSGSLPASWSKLQQVQSINLFNNRLNGTLPISWGSISQLVELQLGENSLQGPLPSSWSSLSHLEHLALHYNALTGTLPAAWGALSQLGRLSLRHNELHGPLPDAWAAMTKLWLLYLRENGLSGTLPESWGNLTKLQELDLSGNTHINGTLPSTWGFPQMDYLELRDNNLTGPFPDSFNVMTKISTLDLYRNMLSGTLPESWGKSLSQVQYLNLSMNHLNGSLPSSWGGLSQVASLGLSFNHLTGNLPDSWHALGSVTLLELSFNSLTGHLPDSWRALRSVTYLDLNANRLSGALPSSYSLMRQLISLNVGYNLLSGPLPSSYSSFPQLKMLALANNSLTGPIPESYTNFSQLSTLSLWNNSLEGTLPVSFGRNSSQLMFLDLSNNSLIGTLPSSWSSWTQVHQLFLGNNSFTGTLPASWSSMSQLTWLSMLGNNLGGSLPSSWSNLTQLIKLELQRNQLTGSLPDSWAHLNIYVLDLGDNSINGTLPASWMLKVLYINLRMNSLSGTLPPSWSSWPNVSTIDLGYNKIAGTFPETWSTNMSSRVYYASLAHNQMSGRVPRGLRSAMILDMSFNQLTSVNFDDLPGDLQILYLDNNNLTGTFPPDGQNLLVFMKVLNVSHNSLTGPLPSILPENLSVFDVSNNDLTSELPSSWSSLPRMAELRIDDNPVEGTLPAGWSAWGKGTQNSLQLSIENTRLHGDVPSQWVQQFCLAIDRAADARILFRPLTIEFLGSSITAGPLIELTAQHASINVTLGTKAYHFDYSNPSAICGIPDAVRTLSLVWGIFGAFMLVTFLAVKCWQRRKSHNSTLGTFSKLKLTSMSHLSVITSSVSGKQQRLMKLFAERAWYLAFDVVWNFYSQITDAITIHQVFESGHLGYAYVLLSILLLPYAFMWLLLVRVSFCSCQEWIPLGSRSCQICAAGMSSVLLSPVVLFLLEVDMIVQGLGLPWPSFHGRLNVSCFSFYRAQSLAETLFNALPQSIVQSKLYLMGNDPTGVHVYISTTLYLFSVTGSLLSILKTIPVVMSELHHHNLGVRSYCAKLLRLESIQGP